MTWTTPSLRNTGERITASIWNTDLVQNLLHLFNRKVTMFFYAQNTAGTGMGNVPAPSLTNGTSAFIAFLVPEDVANIETIQAIVIDQDAGTLQYDLTSDYGNPELGEAFNVHTESSLNQQVVTVALEGFYVDLSAVLTSLEPGDLVGIRFNRDSQTGGNNGTRVVGVRLVYTR